MKWLLGARRLRERGVLGMNCRNAEYVLAQNRPKAIALVDDKLRVHKLCARIGVPTPRVFAVIQRLGDLKRVSEQLAATPEFVIKPARGSGGRGVLVLVSGDNRCFRRSNGGVVCWPAISDHLADILSGMHSLGGRPDIAIVQQRVRLYPELAPLCVHGIPDVRVIMYRGRPAMAMLPRRGHRLDEWRDAPRRSRQPADQPASRHRRDTARPDHTPLAGNSRSFDPGGRIARSWIFGRGCRH